MTDTLCSRVHLAGAIEDRLFFAQVREDPRAELAVFQPKSHQKFVVVGSGGCTALSLLAAGPCAVVAVDLNTSQNHLIELKSAALSKLPWTSSLEFLGALSNSESTRLSQYEEIRPALSKTTRKYWDDRKNAIKKGVISQGVTEKFLAFIVTIVRIFVHPRKRMVQLLSLKSLPEQKIFYQETWDNRRWKLLFSLLLNRLVFKKTYHPAFFQHVKNPSFARHFYNIFKDGITGISVSNNYFLHQMLTGTYPVGVPDGLPPYLSESGVRDLKNNLANLTLVDGSYTEYLKTCPDNSIHGFALSNILEWLQSMEAEELLREIIRTAVPGGRLIFRNFVGWTDIPEKFKNQIALDENAGAELIKNERSLMQARIAVGLIKKDVPNA